MKLYHKTPCDQCPWRTKAPAGWLGGHSPEGYADAVDNNEVPACHQHDHGPESPETAMCAGALTTMRNQCKAAYNTVGGDAARLQVKPSLSCFRHVRDFYRHHAWSEYVPPLMRPAPIE